jgi:intracellular sulfur oxidation DsrE/DsrF family protein
MRGVGIACGAAVAASLLVLPVSAQTKDKLSPPTKVKKYRLARTHGLAIQVDQNDKSVMDLALNNAQDVINYYKSKGEFVYIEIVAIGPGLHMLRADTSPVKDRVAAMALKNPNLTFVACGNTQATQSKAEGVPIKLLSAAKVVRSGVVRLMELRRDDYAYIRP